MTCVVDLSPKHRLKRNWDAPDKKQMYTLTVITIGHVRVEHIIR